MFFYGTLRHVPLLEVVLGRTLAHLETCPAVLSDHGVFWVADEPFPMLVDEPGGHCDGLLVQGLDDRDCARLDLYEGGSEYRLVTKQVQTPRSIVAARIYEPVEGILRPAGRFEFDRWLADYGAAALHSAREIESVADRCTPDDIDRLWPAMKARAHTRAAAEAAAPRPSPVGLARDAVEVSGVNRPYVGFYALEEWRFRRARFDGGWSNWMEHALLVSTDSAIVLPYDPMRDQVLMVEQMRISLLARGDAHPWCLEPVAGRIDPGETPEQCARREMLEEAGLEATRLVHVSSNYPSPGNCTEFFHCFIGLTDLSGQGGQVAGLEEENEDIKRHVFGFEDALRMADEDRFPAGPLVTLLNWLARHRAAFRAAT